MLKIKIKEFNNILKNIIKMNDKFNYIYKNFLS